MRRRHSVDGGCTDGAGGRTSTTLDPATNAVIAEVPTGDDLEHYCRRQTVRVALGW
jgi:hypothetical protein